MAKKKAAPETPEVVPGAVEVIEAEAIEVPAELAIIKQEYGLALSDDKVSAHIQTYAPFFKQLVDLEPEITALLTEEITPETEKKAAELRKKYMKIRTTTDKQKKADKEEINVEGKFLDKVYNRVKEAAEEKEKQCEEVENKLQQIENDRIAALRTLRIGVLEALNYDTEFLTVEEMSEESFDRLVKKATEAKQALEMSEQQRAEAEKIKREAEERKTDRINQLAALGLAFNPEGPNYAGKDGTLLVATLDAPDSIFNDALGIISVARDKRLQAEEDALQAERDAAAKLTERINKITALSFKWNNQAEAYENDDYILAMTYVKGAADEDFNKAVEDIAAAEAKKAEDAEQYERREKYLLDLGLQYDEELDAYDYKTLLRVTASDVEEKSVEDFSALYLDVKKQVEADKKAEEIKKAADQKAIDEANKIKAQEAARLKKIEDDKKAEAEEKRKAALAPDKTKVGNIYRAVRDIEFPEMATPEGKNALERIKALQEKFKAFIAEEGKKLA